MKLDELLTKLQKSNISLEDEAAAEKEVAEECYDDHGVTPTKMSGGSKKKARKKKADKE